MTAQIFLMDEQTIATVKAYALEAAKPENWYRPFSGTPVPGDIPHGKIKIGSHSVVFSWTVADRGDVCRHLSIRTLLGNAYASPHVVFTVAYWLGFQNGEPDDHGLVWSPAPTWQVVVNDRERTIVVGEVIDPQPVSS